MDRTSLPEDIRDRMDKMDREHVSITWGDFGGAPTMVFMFKIADGMENLCFLSPEKAREIAAGLIRVAEHMEDVLAEKVRKDSGEDSMLSLPEDLDLVA